jgi:hypothetical protein
MVIGHIPVQEMMQSRIDTSPIPVIIVRWMKVSSRWTGLLYRFHDALFGNVLDMWLQCNTDYRFYKQQEKQWNEQDVGLASVERSWFHWRKITQLVFAPD